MEHISIWKLINKSWFLEKEYMKSRIGGITFKDHDKKKKFNSYLYIENNYFNFKVPSNNLTPEDFKGYTYSIKILQVRSSLNIAKTISTNGIIIPITKWIVFKAKK